MQVKSGRLRWSVLAGLAVTRTGRIVYGVTNFLW